MPSKTDVTWIKQAWQLMNYKQGGWTMEGHAPLKANYKKNIFIVT